MVFDTVKEFSDWTAMRWFKEDSEDLNSITYRDLGEIVTTAFYGLHSLGLKKSEQISLCAETSPHWAFADLGIQCIGAVTVAIYPVLTPKEVLYIIDDSESVALIVDGEENLEKYYSIKDDLPNIRFVIVLEKFNESLKKENVYSWDELMEMGKAHKAKHPNLLKESIENINEEDLAGLIYTSGTTGVPKGVMLTHKNFLSDVLMVSAIAITLDPKQSPEDVDSITYLPYAHSYGRTVEEYAMIFNASRINYVGGATQELLQRGFQKFKPTIMVGVPYLFQKLYEKIVDTVATYPERIQKIFNSAKSIGRKYYENKLNGVKNPLGLRIKYAILGKLVLGRIQKELGGKIKLLVTASAAISEELLLFYWSCGFNIAEGYGLSEAAPATHYSRSDDNSDFRPNFHKKIDVYEKIGTVGPLINIPNNPYGHMEHKLGPDGELLIRGPNIMKGYWKKPKLTEAALDSEGWLHTGDLAEIDDDGYVKIIGRSKAIVKLSTGKMISPVLIETMIVPSSRIVAQIILVGAEKKFLTAIVVPYQIPLKKYAEEHGIKYEKWEDIIRNKEIHQVIKKDILSYMGEVSGFSQPKRFAISSKAFSAEEGFLTPTLKFKRNKVYKDYADIINQLYEVEDEFLIIERRMTDFYDMSVLL